MPAHVTSSSICCFRGSMTHVRAGSIYWHCTWSVIAFFKHMFKDNMNTLDSPENRGRISHMLLERRSHQKGQTFARFSYSGYQKRLNITERQKSGLAPGVSCAWSASLEKLGDGTFNRRET